MDFFLSGQDQPATAITLLVLYFVFFPLMLLSYLRVFLVIQRSPGVTPLGPGAVQLDGEAKKRSRREGDPEAGVRYEARPDGNPDSPGLEAFYSKDIFVCDSYGRPLWCSACCNWKVDRAHHCSELERCVKKMDHYCPWVGGIVGETCEYQTPTQSVSLQRMANWASSAFKFFVQFTFYTTLYSIVVIASAILNLESLLRRGAGIDGFAVAVLALAALFGLFTLTMTATSVRYILINLTAVDYLKSKNVHHLAIRVPRDTSQGRDYRVITYPLPKPSNASGLSGQTAANESSSLRDQLATRTFAVVTTKPGENPWDLGYYRNWTSVMGGNIIDWLFPFNQSPCSSYENNESFYEMGPLCHQLRTRFGLPEVSGGKQETEMQESETATKHRMNANGHTG